MNPRAHAGSPPLDGLLLPVPGALQGRYPQRPLASGDAVDRMLRRMTAALPEAFGRRRRARFVAAVRHARTQAPPFGCAAFDTWIRTVRAGVGRDGLTDDALAPAMAAATIACHHVLGLDPFDTQIITARVMLDARLAEMATGEGKTVAALLAAASAAMAGIPVHLMTANDYLAARDAAELAPVYAALGLRVACLDTDASPQARRDAYRADVTYGTAREFIFDYLRDRLAGVGVGSGLRGRLRVHAAVPGAAPGAATSGPVMRGLCLALIDEADSVLIDEARTPLIISSDVDDAQGRELYAQALALAASLDSHQHYLLRRQERSIELSDAGRVTVAEFARGLPGLWRIPRAREELVEQGLSALHLFQLDRHYLIVDGKLQIVDEYTGRVMADRSWERGLQQMIEVKEGLALSKRRDTISRITYQRFFRRYLCLAGMTGTAIEVAPEMCSVYALEVLPIPPHRPLRRRDLGQRVFLDSERRWAAVVERAAAMRADGRAVLIGTRSVAASELASQRLLAAGLPHAVLNARQDAGEAAIIAQAGQPGRITVATNMAGRGTDIVLSTAVRQAGGLHVILSEYHDAARIDRQLFGRAGRQGDPGSCEAIVSLDDELFVAHAALLLGWLRARVTSDGLLPGALGISLRRFAQRAAERQNSRIRRQTVEMDKQVERSLAFAGRGE